MKPSLATKVIRGSAWVALSMASGQIITYITTLLLAGLLVPDDFGLVALVNLIISTLGLLRGFGLSQAIIYSKKDSHVVSNAAFVLVVFSGLIQFAIATILAPFAASYFGDPRVESVTYALAISLVFSSFGLVPLALLDKKLHFKQKIIPEIIPQFVYAVVAIALALMSFGYWSIVIGRIISSFFFAFLPWLFITWRPSLLFSRKIVTEILIYGKDIVSSSIVGFIFLNVDNLFIGRLLGTTQLGFYTFAFSLANVPVLFVVRLVDTVAFPSYVQLGDWLPTMQQAYLRILRMTLFMTAPISLGILAISNHLILGFYGDKWLASIAVLQILSLYGLARSITTVPTVVVKSIGKQYIMPRIGLLYLAVALLLLLPVTKNWGIVGVASLMTMVVWAGVAIWIILVSRYLSIPLDAVAQRTLSPILAAAIMLIVVWRFSLFVPASVGGVAILIALGIAAYLFTLILLTRGEILEEVLDIADKLLGRPVLGRFEG